MPVDGVAPKGRGQALYARACERIPGGTQLLSKRPELFLPDGWPSYYARAQGVEVTDLDGRTFVDVSLHGVGACPLGFADPEVDAAVIEAVRAGNMCTLNAPEEVELAEKLCALHPWAEQVRYTRSGGEAMSVAVRIARAATGKQVVLVAGYHGWHDWYLAANLDRPEALDRLLLPRVSTAGVPRALTGTSIAFDIADRAGFDAAIEEAGDDLAAVVIEPARYERLSDEDAAYLREATHRHGGALIFDEITSGFRLDIGGAHRSMHTQPDLCVFAKGMSNGYPMAAVIGRRSVMEAAGRAFVSSTSWTDRIGPTAALATIAKFERVADGAPSQPEGVVQHLGAMGDRMRAGWRRLADSYGLSITTRGIAPLPSFSLEYDDAPALHTLYTQEMLDRGFLASGAFYASYAHQAAHVDAALSATDAAFEVLSRAVDAGDIVDRLRGPVAHRGLRGAPPKENR